MAWDRQEAMEPQCGFGQLGICCRICTMGPCRIDPFGEGPSEGICGATADIIAARNLVRMIASGAAAHSDHGRDIAHTLLMAAERDDCDYQIKDAAKLRALADELGVPTEGKSLRQIAHGVAEIAFGQFGQQHGEVVFAARAPRTSSKRWREAGVVPRGVDREVVEIMHRTHMGVDNDPINIMLQGVRAALADGWGGSMIATELSDVLFGTPHLGPQPGQPRRPRPEGRQHHRPRPRADAVGDDRRRRAGPGDCWTWPRARAPTGINLAGICCTANEILMRHGIPLAGNFLQQELAIATGAVDAMVVDVQCVMPALGKLAQKYHTKFISTSPKAKFPYAEHIEFDESKALEIAKQIVRTAIENFPNRKTRGLHPRAEQPAGGRLHGREHLHHAGRALPPELPAAERRDHLRPAPRRRRRGRLQQPASSCHDYGHLAMAKELLANDVLVAVTGCSAVADAKAGLLRPEAAEEYAGAGLREICRAVGIPPVLHLGSCVDISRILVVLSNVVAEGGLGQSIADLPVAGAAPEWMSEKAVVHRLLRVASGVYTVLGEPLPVQGAPKLTEFLCGGIEKMFGGKFAFEPDPVKAARMMIDHIDAKRAALHLAGPMYPVPYAPRTAAEAKAAV